MVEAQCSRSEIGGRFQTKKQDSLSAGHTSLSDKIGVNDVMLLLVLS